MIHPALPTRFFPGGWVIARGNRCRPAGETGQLFPDPAATMRKRGDK